MSEETQKENPKAFLKRIWGEFKHLFIFYLYLEKAMKLICRYLHYKDQVTACGKKHTAVNDYI